MNTDQLYELNEVLGQDELWQSALENALSEMYAKDLDDLVERTLEEKDEGVITNLINEGEYIIALKTEGFDEYFIEDEY